MALVDLFQPPAPALSFFPPSSTGEPLWERLDFHQEAAPDLFSLRATLHQTIPLEQPKDTRSAREALVSLINQLGYTRKESEDLELATGEITANAVNHGEGGNAQLIQLTSQPQPGIIVEVKNKKAGVITNKGQLHKTRSPINKDELDSYTSWQRRSGLLLVLAFPSIETSMYALPDQGLVVRLFLGLPLRHPA